MRFWAALWVALFHFGGFVGVALDRFQLTLKGYLGVDFFFILSGFILAHVYRAPLLERRGTYDHVRFLVKRLARIYPMHVAMIAAYVVLGYLTRMLHMEVENPARFDFSKIPMQLLLVHAWWEQGFELNTPSWSISAEWFAYLWFPLVMLVARSPRALFVGGLLAFTAWYFGSLYWFGEASTRVGFGGCGLLRIAPEFTIGVALRELLETGALPLTRGPLAVAAWLSAIAVGLFLRLPDYVFVLAFVFIIAAGAERARSGRRGWLEHPRHAYLGEISYALYMVHGLVGLIGFNLVDALAPGVASGPYFLRLLAWSTVMGCMVLTAAIAERVIERPGRRLLMALGQRSLVDTRVA